MSPQLALLGELQFNIEKVYADEHDGSTSLQSAAMFAARFWLTPRVWVQGGAGLANFHVADRVNAHGVGTGFSAMGGFGYELLSSTTISLDLQARVIEGRYNGFDDGITSVSFGIAINTYVYKYAL
jgi:hypothetical protein